MANNSVNAARALIEQGLMMGWGDEAEAKLRSIFGSKTYDQALKEINKDYGKFAEEHPVVQSGLEFAGGALPAVAAVLAAPETGGASLPAAARSAGAFKRFITPVAKGAGIGAATGAVSGAGTAQQGQRGSGAITGGSVGAVLGGSIPVVAPAISGGARWLTDRLAPSEQRVTDLATGKLRQALERSDLTPSDISAQFAQDARRNIPSVVANVSPATAKLAEAVAQRTGAGAEEIATKLGEQRAGTGQRVVQQVRQGLQSKGDYYGKEASMMDALRRNANTLYNDAYQIGTVNDPMINQILEHPKFREFYDEARKIADADALNASLRGEDPSQFQLKQVFTVGPDGVAQVKELPDVRTLDYIKRGMDSYIDKGYKGANPMSTQEARALRDTRNLFVNAVDEATTDPATGVSPYKKARQKYSGDLETLDALHMGMDDFHKLDPEEVSKLVSNMTDNEADAFRTGVTRNLLGTIWQQKSPHNAARNIIGSPAMRSKLRVLFPDEGSFNLFKSALDRESQLFEQSNRILGGSATAMRSQMAKDLEEAPGISEAGMDMVTGGPWHALSNIAMRMTRSSQMTEDTANKLAGMLMSSDPHEVAGVVKLLENYDKRAAPAAQRARAATAGGISGASTAINIAPPSEDDQSTIESAIQDNQFPISSSTIEDDIKALEEQRGQ